MAGAEALAGFVPSHRKNSHRQQAAWQPRPEATNQAVACSSYHHPQVLSLWSHAFPVKFITVHFRGEMFGDSQLLLKCRGLPRSYLPLL